MICVSVLARDRRDGLRKMARAFGVADLVELRIDRLQTPDLTPLIGAKKGRIIVTCRRKGDGGFFVGSEQDRVDLLKKAVVLGADFVDIEVKTAKRLIGGLFTAVEVNGGVTEVMVSHHDFRGTPSYPVLLGRLNACRALGADMVKIVTYANAVEDNLRLLQLVTEAGGKGQKIVAFCMGPKGRVSRIMAPVFGSALSYASLRRGAETAPGQLTVSEMREALRITGGGGS